MSQSFAQPAYPADNEWIFIGTDPEEGGLHNDQRDVESLYYHVRDGYLFLRMKNRGPAGWCTTCGQSREHARYKWLFDTVGNDGVLQGGHVLNTEFMLFTEDFNDDLLGEAVFIDRDPMGDYNTRWSTVNPPEYTTGVPVGAPFANWQRQFGAVDTGLITPVPPIASTQYLGIPQFGGNTAVGYRVYGDIGPMDDANMDGVPGPFPDGIYVDMYVDIALLGSPDSIRLIWLTDQEDQNLDQAPCCDRPDDDQFIVLPLTASLTIEKDVPGGNAQDFNFTLTPAAGAPASFDLDDDADPTLSNTQTFTALDPGSYTISEAALPMGWSFGALTCRNNNGNLATITIDTANRSAQIDLEGGSDVSCSFVNIPPVVPGQFSLSVIKDALPHGPQSFDFTLVGGMVNTAFALTDPASNSAYFDLVVGSPYVLNEAAVAGWVTNVQCSGAAVTIVGGQVTLPDTIVAGTQVTCVYTNTQNATVTIAKTALEAGSGSFSFSSNLPGFANFALSSGNSITANDVAPGNYTVAEAGQAGYVLQNIVCVDSTNTSVFDSDLSSGTVSMNVAPGADVTCTYTNAELGHLIIVLDAIPDGAQVFDYQAGPGNFSLSDDGSAAGNCQTPSINSRCFDDVTPGEYIISQNLPIDWNLQSISCSGGAALIDLPNRTLTATVDPGATMTCTFVNVQNVGPFSAQPIPMLDLRMLLALAGIVLLIGALAYRDRLGT